MLLLVLLPACVADLGDRRFEGEPSLVEDAHVSTVIIGGGVAGLAVATRIDEGLLLDGAEQLGGRALDAGGLLYFVDYPEQSALGEEDSVATALEEWERFTGEAPCEATTAWMEGLSGIYEQVAAMGLEIEDLIEDPVLHRHRLAMLSGGGPALVEALSARVGEGVEIRLQTRVDSVWTQSGRARGVILSDGTVIGADHTVIASGGFASSVARVGALAEVADLPYGTWAEAADGGATGDALDWAEAQGWGTRALDDMGWFRNSMGFPGSDGRPLKMLTTRVVPWVWINQDGARFVDESSFGSVSLSTPWAEQEQVWGLTTEAALDEYVLPEEQASLEAGLAEGEAIFCEDDASLLAARLGVDAEQLQLTLEEIAEARRASADDSLQRPGSTLLDYSGALCAFKPGIQAQKSFGGLDVDLEGRVLDADGDPIPQLYAVGEAAGMAVPGLGGRSGFDGALTAVLWSGWGVGELLAAGD